MSTAQSTPLGGSAAHINIHRIGFGLMMMTWTSQPTPDDQAFETIKTAISSVPEDHKVILNSGEFYGINPREANLQLLARFFEKYPELADRCILSVKGGTSPTDLTTDASPANLRRSVTTINANLAGKKSLDIFECARVDPKVSIEDTMRTLVELQKEGLIGHISLSEVSANTLRRAAAVAPVAAIEIEVSPWAYEEETKNVIQTAKELGVVVVAYSPLGRGFLTGQLKSKDLPEGDFRRHLSKFQEEAEAHNQKLVDALSKIAERKGVTNAQLCLAWVLSLGPHVVPIPGSSKASRVRENFAAVDITFTPEELKEINDIIAETPIKGGRYRDLGSAELLWG
ncbi:hypothetical protein FRB99_000149 [Tulasnella sp. 403]|nr:hypothetical protein FRB99_000149 [Tulasnella sp. 403]